MNLPPLFRWTAASLLLAGLSACQKAPAPSNASSPAVSPTPGVHKIVSAEPSSFDAVARHLDAGGGLYFYLSSESFMKAAAAKLAEVRPMIVSAAHLNDEAKPKFESTWASLARLAGKSGIDEISGFGASSIAIKPGYYQTKWMLHHYEGKGNGVLWKLTGPTAGALNILSYLPERTALASSSDLVLGPIWESIDQEAAHLPDLRVPLDKLSQQVEQATGFQLPKLLDALGPNYSLVLTLDESRPTSFPAPNGGKPITFPEPALALLIQVREPALLQRLDQELAKLPMVVKADEDGLTLRKISSPLPLPFLQPALAWKDGLLIISSNEGLIREMLAVKAGKKPGLAASPEVKKLLEGMPASACSFQITAPSLQKAVVDFQANAIRQQAAANPGGMDPAVERFVQYAMGLSQQGWIVSATQNTPEGWLGVSRGGAGPAQVVAVAAIAPAAILAGIAVPNFVRARSRSQATHVLQDLRMLDAATNQWALEQNKPNGAQPTTDDLAVYVKPGTDLKTRLNSRPGQTSVPSFGGMGMIVLPPAGKEIVVPKEVVAHFSKVCPPDFWGPFLGH